jgi:dihydropyrimidinase
MAFDLLILNGTLVTPEDRREQDIAVEGEKIAAVAGRGELGTQAARTIDAAGCLVIPGGVDPHVHYAMRFGPVVTEGPEFSAACAYGGTTTVLDFAFHEPNGTVQGSIDAKKADFDGRMAVDYGLHVIMTKGFSYPVVAELGDVFRNGVPTVKAMMTYDYSCNDGQLWGLMNEVGRHGGMSMVHAEDEAIANWLTGQYIREGKVHGAYVSEVRGPIVEEAAIRRAMLLAERAGSPLYILHIAAGAGVAALAEARARGLPFYGETLSSYLSFTQDNLWDDGPVEADGKVYQGRGLLYNNYPTLKSAADRDTCWQAVADGRLATVATDHSVASVRDRFETLGTTLDGFVQAGQVATELRVPLLYSEGVHAGRLNASRWVELTAANPAKLMGLWPRKGTLAAGSDADIVVFDPDRRWTVRWQDLHMSVPYSLWDGWELTGQVRDTVLRGSVLVENGSYRGSKTSGRFLPRRLLPQVAGAQPDHDFTFRAKPAVASR